MLTIVFFTSLWSVTLRLTCQQSSLLAFPFFYFIWFHNAWCYKNMIIFFVVHTDTVLLLSVTHRYQTVKPLYMRRYFHFVRKHLYYSCQICIPSTLCAFLGISIVFFSYFLAWYWRLTCIPCLYFILNCIYRHIVFKLNATHQSCYSCLHIAHQMFNIWLIDLLNM